MDEADGMVRSQTELAHRHQDVQIEVDVVGVSRRRWPLEGAVSHDRVVVDLDLDHSADDLAVA